MPPPQIVRTALSKLLDVTLSTLATGNLLRWNGTRWANVAPTANDDFTQYTLLAGRSGGQSLIGGTSSGNTLTLTSTSHATKGKLLFGTSAYDDVNNRLGVGIATPLATLDIKASALNADALKITHPSNATGLRFYFDSFGTAHMAVNSVDSQLYFDNDIGLTQLLYLQKSGDSCTFKHFASSAATNLFQINVINSHTTGKAFRIFKSTSTDQFWIDGQTTIFIANSGSVPTSNPVGGGFLYCDAGALKFRGSSGTITTLGAA